MDNLIKEIISYGALGVIVVGLSWFILWYIKWRAGVEDKIQGAHRDAIKEITETHRGDMAELLEAMRKEKAADASKHDGYYKNMMEVINRNTAAFEQNSRITKDFHNFITSKILGGK